MIEEIYMCKMAFTKVDAWHQTCPYHLAQFVHLPGCERWLVKVKSEEGVGMTTHPVQIGQENVKMIHQECK